MFKDFIKQDIAVQLYPIMSLIVFVVFFIALSMRAMMYNKQELNEMSSIPLDASDAPVVETINSHK